MATNELKVTRIGNSRGVRLPASTLQRYKIGATVIMEERSDGILLRPAAGTPAKSSWAETAKEMAEAAEDWTDWDVATPDGLAQARWTGAPNARVREKSHGYPEGGRRRRK
jgi:antitoxin component of MazEF toxin-antitoxin module